MKRIILTLIVSLLFITSAGASHRSFLWDRNPDIDEVIDYKLYSCLTNPCSPAGTLIATIPQTAVGVVPKAVVPHQQRSFACVTARNADGESGCSNTIPFGVPGDPRNMGKQ